MGRLTPLIVALAGIASGPPAKDAPKEAPKPVRVTMVVILASTTDTTINPKLKTLAEEVQRKPYHQTSRDGRARLLVGK